MAAITVLAQNKKNPHAHTVLINQFPVKCGQYSNGATKVWFGEVKHHVMEGEVD